MRKVIVLEFITLDGVIQAPGGQTEDPSGGFQYGGWQAPYADPVISEAMAEQIKPPFDLLLGRKTYDIFAAYWPHHEDFWTGVNAARKYVASRNPAYQPSWNNSVLLTGDVAGEVRKLKDESGPDLKVYGSGELVQTLLRHDLVDELWLKIYPITLGAGKRLFADGAIPAAFRLTGGQITPGGIIVATYERAGEVQTGEVDV